MTIYMYIATFAWACLVLGFLQRKNRKLHVSLMLTGIIFDILLVLYLQVTREAVQTAVSFTLGTFEMIHIGFSTLALLLYFPVMFLGYKLLKNPGDEREKLKMTHARFAVPALAFRTLGFFFMFSMLK